MSTPSLLDVNDETISEMLSVVGHSETEIAEALPVFRQQFLTLYFLALATYLEKDKAEQLIARAKSGEPAALLEMTQGVPEEELFGCYMFAFEETYSAYFKEIAPHLSQEQKDKLKEHFDELVKQGPHE